MRLLNRLLGIVSSNSESALPTSAKKNITTPAISNKLPAPTRSGADNFNQFTFRHGDFFTGSEHSSSSSRRSSFAESIHPQSSIDKLVQETSARIDRGIAINWDDFALKNPGVANHVAGIKEKCEELNRAIKRDMAERIEPLPGYIKQAQDREELGIGEEAKQQTKRGFKETVGIKRKSKKEARYAERDKIKQERLNKIAEVVTKQVRQSVANLERDYPKALEDVFTAYFRENGIEDVPAALQELKTKLLFEQATAVVNAELSRSNEISWPNETTVSSGTFEQTSLTERHELFARQDTVALVGVIDNTVSESGPMKFQIDDAKPNNSTIASGNSSAHSESSRPSSVLESSTPMTSTKAPSISTSSGSEYGAHLNSISSVQQFVDGASVSGDRESNASLSEDDLSTAINFLGGDGLAAHIKEFLEKGKLPEEESLQNGKLPDPS